MPDDAVRDQRFHPCRPWLDAFDLRGLEQRTRLANAALAGTNASP